MFGGSTDSQAQILNELRQIDQRLCSLEASVTTLGKIMSSVKKSADAVNATADQVLADVTAEKSLLSSIQTFVSGLKQQILDAAGDQDKINQIFAVAEANNAAANAILANTPVAPPAQV